MLEVEVGLNMVWFKWIIGVTRWEGEDTNNFDMSVLKFWVKIEELLNRDPKAQILQGHQGHGNLNIIAKSPEWEKEG